MPCRACLARPCLAVPPGLGGRAARARADQQEARASPRLGCKLQAAALRQRQRPRRLGDDQGDGGGAQRLLHRPQEVDPAVGPQQMQPFIHALRQACRHRHPRRMGRQDPEQRTGKARRLEGREGVAAGAFHLVHAGGAQDEGVVRGDQVGDRIPDRTRRRVIEGPLQRVHASGWGGKVTHREPRNASRWRNTRRTARYPEGSTGLETRMALPTWPTC